MDGAKSAAETSDLYNIGGREAFRLGRRLYVRRAGPPGKEYPAGSSSIVQCESAPSKGLGFLEDVYQARVSRS